MYDMVAFNICIHGFGVIVNHAHGTGIRLYQKLAIYYSLIPRSYSWFSVLHAEIEYGL